MLNAPLQITGAFASFWEKVKVTNLTKQQVDLEEYGDGLKKVFNSHYASIQLSLGQQDWGSELKIQDCPAWILLTTSSP